MKPKRHRRTPVRDSTVSSLRGYLSGMGPNQQLPCEVALASHLGVSRKTVRQSLDILEQENLVVRIHGRGTFRHAVASSSNPHIIYHLIPCANYGLLPWYSINEFNAYQSGLLEACAGTDWRVVMLPYSRTNHMTDIDMETLEVIEEGAKVFVNGMWYRHCFRFLQEHHCDVCFVHSQNFERHFPDDDHYTPIINTWHRLYLDQSDLGRIAVKAFGCLGCRRPFLCAQYLHAVTSMFLDGFLEAGGEHYLSYSDENVLDINDLRNVLVKSYQRFSFDGLMLEFPFRSDPDYAHSLAWNLGLPEDMPVILTEKYDFCLHMRPQVPFMEYDWRRICADAVGYFMADRKERSVDSYKPFISIPKEMGS